MNVYIVVENGEPYLVAVDAVKLKYKDEIEENPINVIDVPEAKEGPSHLYIEKGISIYIHRLPVF
jgi:hypothetical protein